MIARRRTHIETHGTRRVSAFLTLLPAEAGHPCVKEGRVERTNPTFCAPCLRDSRSATFVKTKGHPKVALTSAGLAKAQRHVLLDVACWRTSEHRFVGIERVLDLAIEIEIVLRRLHRHRRRRWLVRRDPHVPIPFEARAGGNQP